MIEARLPLRDDKQRLPRGSLHGKTYTIDNLLMLENSNGFEVVPMLGANILMRDY